MRIWKQGYIIIGLLLSLTLFFSINYYGTMEKEILREILIWTPTFNIYRHSHKVWRNREMAEYILGRRYEEFKKKNSTDKLVQEVQPRKLDFIINNATLCRSSGRLEFVISIYTAPTHFKDRDTIRKTWGRQNLLAGHTSRTVFLLGAVVDPELQEKILNESKTYGDIAQANFIDSYYNLSLKGISQLQWINDYCSNARYLVKTDDDMYVDILQVVKAIQALVLVPRFILGSVISHAYIVRHDIPKWNVQKDLMPVSTQYPLYCLGWIYIMPNAISSDLYKAAMTTPVFHIDDVYITGLLAGQLPNLDFLEFNGKILKGTFMPTHPRMASECEAPYKITLFCKHLTQLRKDDKNLMGEGKSEIVTGELDCVRLLREKSQKYDKLKEDKL